MKQLNYKINEKAIKPDEMWNDYWNIYICYYKIIEPYITLCYIIKNKEKELFQYIMKEIYIIFQDLAILKPKYVKAMLRQQYILDTKIANLIL